MYLECLHQCALQSIWLSEPDGDPLLEGSVDVQHLSRHMAEGEVAHLMLFLGAGQGEGKGLLHHMTIVKGVCVCVCVCACVRACVCVCHSHLPN